MLLRVIISFLHVALTATTSAAAQDAQIKGKMMSSRGGSMSRLGGVKAIMVGLCIASLLTWTIVTNAVGPIGTTAQTAVALVGGIVSILAYGIVIWAMQYDAMGVVSARNQRGLRRHRRTLFSEREAHCAPDHILSRDRDGCCVSGILIGRPTVALPSCRETERSLCVARSSRWHREAPRFPEIAQGSPQPLRLFYARGERGDLEPRRRAAQPHSRTFDAASHWSVVTYQLGSTAPLNLVRTNSLTSGEW